jgi:polyvinyl alcohol dehydrogenase (cytochrome)
MTFACGRLPATIVAISFALQLACSLEVRAQGAVAASAKVCADGDAGFTDALSQPHWNGWGVDPAQHRFQSSEMAQLPASDVPRLRLKWAFGFPGATRAVAQPTIFGGRLFVGSQQGKVYSLDAKSGCTHWVFDAAKGVRSSVVVGQSDGHWAAYFGDEGANVYSIDALTGKVLWTTKVDDHPVARITGSPTLVGTTLFVPVSSVEEFIAANPSYPCCSFRGSVVALETSTGAVLWKGFSIAEKAMEGARSAAGTRRMGPSGGAIWSAPTFDGDGHRIYATTGDNYSDPPTATSDAVLAFDSASGELAWSRQITSGDAFNLGCATSSPGNCPESKGPDLDFGSSAVLTKLSNGKRALIAAQKSGVVTALDPDSNGAVIWQKRVGQGGSLGGVQWGVAADEYNVYVAVSDAVLRVVVPGVSGSKVSTLNPTVALLMSSNTGGGMLALRLDTGEEIWRTPHPGCDEAPGCSPAQSAAVTALPGLVFSGGLDGWIRAYSSSDGRIVWAVDTKHEYQTVNGIAARGGSIDGAGAVVVGGIVYIASGSGFLAATPGNVLLAYSVDGL